MQCGGLWNSDTPCAGREAASDVFLDGLNNECLKRPRGPQLPNPLPRSPPPLCSSLPSRQCGSPVPLVAHPQRRHFSGDGARQPARSHCAHLGPVSVGTDVTLDGTTAPGAHVVIAVIHQAVYIKRNVKTAPPVVTNLLIHWKLVLVYLLLLLIYLCYVLLEISSEYHLLGDCVQVVDNSITELLHIVKRVIQDQLTCVYVVRWQSLQCSFWSISYTKVSVAKVRGFGLYSFCFQILFSNFLHN